MSIKFEHVNGTLYRMVEPEAFPTTERCGGCGNILYDGECKSGMCENDKPQPAYTVGDWVEWRGDQYKVETAPPQSGGRYNIRSVYSELECSVLPESITRKLAPSEIVVHIGCLSGTLIRNTDTSFFLLHKDKRVQAVIPFAMLNEPTRNLVKELLERQEEGK